MPKISVIIPVYNVEKYLRECLDSVVNQTLTDIEIICVDDGSPDNSLQILEEYADKDDRIKIIEQKENQGVSIARNIAIDKAKGDFITFLDADDYLEVNDFYEKMYNHAIKTKADIIKGYYKSNERGIITENINNKIKEDKNNFICEFASAIYNSGLLKNNKIYFPNLSDMEDPVFAFICALKANKIEIVNVNYIVVNNPESVTRCNVSSEQVLDKIKGLQIILDLCGSNKITKRCYCYVTNFWFSIIYKDIFKCKNLKTRINGLKMLHKLYSKLKYISPIIKVLPLNKYELNLLFRYVMQQIFSIKNDRAKKHKVITILGIKIKVKRKEN